MQPFYFKCLLTRIFFVGVEVIVQFSGKRITVFICATYLLKNRVDCHLSHVRKIKKHPRIKAGYETGRICILIIESVSLLITWNLRVLNL